MKARTYALAVSTATAFLAIYAFAAPVTSGH